MTNRHPNVPDPAHQAAIRLREITELSDDIRTALAVMRETLGEPNGAMPRDVLAKLNDLHTAHLKWLTAEEKFHERTAQDIQEAAIDFDAIRAEIRGRLDRLRAAQEPAGVSGGAE